ncbi:hypothetical protein [Mesorhizobium sp.]|uniref:hypothetical protein n=1 Tax=Mesorhizobium sp. TaxID=1871066 RepID=UPI000FE8503D|nr:hypothetical protein [Mesorhizobium sp.]RWD71074.1 MAG: hypothetical protein EOS37_12750 [Mesorhizobium sp.]TIV32673.1 MAG: hypothetical protein E5V90_02060 [Mesorhizobium sp.]
MPVEITKLRNWTYRMSLATAHGSAVVEVTIPAPKSRLFTEGEREVEACNAALGIVGELLNELSDIAIDEL